jgi:hypothetical protein
MNLSAQPLSYVIGEKAQFPIKSGQPVFTELITNTSQEKKEDTP